MSNKVSVLVYSRKIGSPIRKAVLVYFAERASDNGEGIWASKRTIAEAIECGRSTVIRTINDFIEEGILEPVGTRKCSSGETVEYRINLRVVSQLPDAHESPRGPRAGLVPERDGSQSGTGGVPERDAKGSQSGTQTTIGTTIEPSKKDQSAPDPTFSQFWTSWPLGKVGKKKAETAFKRLSSENKKKATTSAGPWCASWKAANPTANDIHPTSYLNGRRWEDEFNSSPQSPVESTNLQKWKRMAGAK